MKTEKLTLGDLVEIKITHEKLVKTRLLGLVCFFQDNMWDGSGDEDDPKYVTKEEFDAIEALADKIEHMIFNIGCPNSVQPMLHSIITRKIKHWQGSDSVETDDRTYFVPYKDEQGQTRTRTLITKGHRKGKQLKTRSEKIIVKKSAGYYGDKGIILTGHFRWNNRGYLLSRKATDMLEDYYHENFL